VIGIRRGSKSKDVLFLFLFFRLFTIFFFGNRKDMKQVAASTSSSCGSCVTEVGGLLAVIWNHVCDVFL
jgi:hypothetical protein